MVSRKERPPPFTGAGLRLLSPAFYGKENQSQDSQGQVSEFLEKMQKPGYEKKRSCPS